ncbi:MAG: response regulator [Acidisphaera sp.]|nr:response regulator [Acidisphaera sp.]
MGRRILLVEDDELIRLSVAELLEEAGFIVIAAESGDAAAEQMDRSSFDLLLTDLQMPGRLNGVGLAMRARCRHPDLPIVIMTGRPDALADLGRLGDREALLPKPFRAGDVLAALRPLLGQPEG